MNDALLIVEDLKNLGLTEYEAKAYLSLLEEYPVNGYTLSKISGIPRSRIYEVLESLKNKQLVFEQREDTMSVYKPLDPKLFIGKFKNNFDSIFHHIEEYSKKVYLKEENDHKLIVIQGRNKIIDFLNLLIHDAKRRIVLSIWEEEINDISKALNDAIQRGVMLRGMYFGRNNPYEQLVTHRRLERHLSEKKERYMTVTVDGVHVLYGIISRGEDSQITWAKDPDFVDMSEDYVVHDLMVNLYANQLDIKQREEYEKFLDHVRKEYFAFTEEEFNKFK
ncbi:TrmB family transcriptional regulator [Inediibacterium massiliense]|uniref:TrmB family transcriptional regulator n=1 Tax=Inediibacterium massiliense TaxID=1658111 RepID=UPI0006B4FE8D|nr:helix-turn-helix domain-containing protein [Inediibacterium massiliense]